MHTECKVIAEMIGLKVEDKVREYSQILWL